MSAASCVAHVMYPLPPPFFPPFLRVFVDPPFSSFDAAGRGLLLGLFLFCGPVWLTLDAPNHLKTVGGAQWGCTCGPGPTLWMSMDHDKEQFWTFLRQTQQHLIIIWVTHPLLILDQHFFSFFIVGLANPPSSVMCTGTHAHHHTLCDLLLMLICNNAFILN